MTEKLSVLCLKKNQKQNFSGKFLEFFLLHHKNHFAKLIFLAHKIKKSANSEK
jgi:hypothetical protein